MTPKLKPCPFCGGDANDFVSRYGDKVVGCLSLRCQVNPWTPEAEDWNTRVPEGGTKPKRVGTRSKASGGKTRG